MASKREEVVTWCEINGIDPEETARRLADFDASPGGQVTTQPCFEEPEYELFTRYWSGHSLTSHLWEMYRRLEGHRSMIVLPMGGAMPGAIPVLDARKYLKQEGFAREDWDIALSIWEMMDGIAAERRNVEMSKPE